MTMHTKITKDTTYQEILQQLTDYGLRLTRVYLDQDGFNITLSDAHGTFALGMAPTFHDALEDAFQDVDGLAILGDEVAA